MVLQHKCSGHSSHPASHSAPAHHAILAHHSHHSHHFHPSYPPIPPIPPPPGFQLGIEASYPMGQCPPYPVQVDPYDIEMKRPTNGVYECDSLIQQGRPSIITFNLVMIEGVISFLYCVPFLIGFAALVVSGYSRSSNSHTMLKVAHWMALSGIVVGIGCYATIIISSTYASSAHFFSFHSLHNIFRKLVEIYFKYERFIQIENFV